MSQSSLKLAYKWESITDDLLKRTQGFPKTARYSLSARIDNLAIDVLEDLVEARYTRGQRRAEALKEMNLRLARLRVLIRLSHRRGYLSNRGYEYVSDKIDEAGRMLGGWIKGVGDGQSGMS